MATKAIVEARTEASAILARLDPLMDNLLRDNAPLLAAWDIARHVEKAPRSKTPPQNQDADSPVPLLLPSATVQPSNLRQPDSCRAGPRSASATARSLK